jgi:hypothetical protein
MQRYKLCPMRAFYNIVDAAYVLGISLKTNAAAHDGAAAFP